MYICKKYHREQQIWFEKKKHWMKTIYVPIGCYCILRFNLFDTVTDANLIRYNTKTHDIIYAHYMDIIAKSDRWRPCYYYPQYPDVLQCPGSVWLYFSFKCVKFSSWPPYMGTMKRSMSSERVTGTDRRRMASCGLPHPMLSRYLFLPTLIFTLV